MTQFLINILLAIAWMLLTGNMSFENLIEGFIFGYIILWFLRYLPESSSYVMRVPRLIKFLAFFIYELIVANLRIAYDVVTPKHRMKPAIIAIPLTVTKDFEILLLANLISLTPGSLSLDVSSDKKFLYVHSMYVSNPEKVIKEIKEGFENKIIELTN